MESCAGRVIVLARRLDGRLLFAPLRSRERLLEAADRRAESASCLWQSLGAEHDQRDGENQEQVCGAEDVFDYLWSLWFRASRPPRRRSHPHGRSMPPERTTPHSRRSSLAVSGVRSLGERRDAGEELWRLPFEQSHG